MSARVKIKFRIQLEPHYEELDGLTGHITAKVVMTATENVRDAYDSEHVLAELSEKFDSSYEDDHRAEKVVREKAENKLAAALRKLMEGP